MKLDKARKMANNIVNEDNEMLEYMLKHPRCEVTNDIVGPTYHPHRIVSTGAGGKYTCNNMIRLSHAMHCEIHAIGMKSFCIKYAVGKIRDILIKRGSWSTSDQKAFTHTQKLLSRTEIIE